MGLLENAANWLDVQRQKSLTVSAVYVRRSGEVLPIRATLGRTLFRAENEYGVAIRTEARDFITSDLANPPERGDKIIHNNRQYEVLAPNGEPIWRRSGNAMRIHTKQILTLLVVMSTYWNGMTESGVLEKYPKPRSGPELRERRVATFWGNGGI